MLLDKTTLQQCKYSTPNRRTRLYQRFKEEIETERKNPPRNRDIRQKSESRYVAHRILRRVRPY